MGGFCRANGSEVLLLTAAYPRLAPLEALEALLTLRSELAEAARARGSALGVAALELFGRSPNPPDPPDPSSLRTAPRRHPLGGSPHLHLALTLPWGEVRYLLGDLENLEGLSPQLTTLRGRPTPRFWLTVNASVPDFAHEDGSLRWFLDTLRCRWPALEQDTFSSDTLSFRPGSGPVERLSRCLTVFLMLEGLLLRTEKAPSSASRHRLWLLRPSPLFPGGVVQNLTSSPEEIWDLLVTFFRGQEAVQRLLGEERSNFLTQLELNGLNLPPRLRLKGLGSYLALQDGGRLFFGPSGVLLEGRAELGTLPTYGRFGARIGWFRLQQLLEEGRALLELQRILFHPALTVLQNRLRLLTLLQWVGGAMRGDLHQPMGLLLWGKSGTAKTTLLQLLGEDLWGEGGKGVVGIGPFGLEGTEQAAVLIMEELSPRSLRTELVKKLLSRAPLRVERKYRGSRLCRFNRVPLMATANYSLASLVADPADLGPLRRRFLELELAPPLEGGEASHNFDARALEEEIPQIGPLALALTFPAVRRALQTEAALVAPTDPFPSWLPLDLLTEEPEALLASRGMDFRRELGERTARGQVWAWRKGGGGEWLTVGEGGSSPLRLLPAAEEVLHPRSSPHEWRRWFAAAAAQRPTLPLLSLGGALLSGPEALPSPPMPKVPRPPSRPVRRTRRSPPNPPALRQRLRRSRRGIL